MKTEPNGNGAANHGDRPLSADGLARLLGNAFQSRAELIRGLTDPRRDVDSECGYPEGAVSLQLFADLYEREPVARRVVQVYPRESWQVQPSVYEDEDPDVLTPFEEAWNDLGRTVRGEHSFYQDEGGGAVWEYLSRADELSGIGHYGVILLGLDDGRELYEPADFVERVERDQPTGPRLAQPAGLDVAPDPLLNPVPVPVLGPQPTAEPINPGPTTPPLSPRRSNGKRGKAVRKLVYLRVFPETLAQVSRREQDPTNPRFGQPTAYTLTFSDPSDSTGTAVLSSTSAEVHWTRVIHVADNRGSSEVFGTPRMRPVLNRLLDLKKLYGGSAEMYWNGAFPGLALTTHPSLGGDVAVDREEIRDMMWDYQQHLQRWLSLSGMDVKSLSPQVVDPTPQINCHIEAICVQLGVPKRVFLGSERGELASSQDDSAWNDRLKARQEGYLTPRLIVPFVDRLILLGVLPRPDGYSVWWPDLTSKSDQEKATIATQRTAAIVQYADSEKAPGVIAPIDFWTRVLDFTEDEAQAIVENAEEEKERLEEEARKKEEEARKLEQDALAAQTKLAEAKAKANPADPNGNPSAPNAPRQGGGLPGGKKAAGEEGDEEEPPTGNELLENVCRDTRGRFATCGTKGAFTAEQLPVLREMQSRFVKEDIEDLRSSRTSPTEDQLKALEERLGFLTVTQLRQIKADYGLKGGKGKEALKARIKEGLSKQLATKPRPAASGTVKSFKRGNKPTLGEVRARVEAAGDDYEKRLDAAKAVMSETETFAGDVWTGGMTHSETMNAVTVDGVDFAYSAGSRDIAAQTLVTLSTGPEIPPKLWESNNRVTFTTQRNSGDAYWEKEFNMPGYRAVATAGRDGVTVYQKPISTNTMAHELGHTLAIKTWGGVTPPEGGAYMKAWAKEDPVTDYARNASYEDFAEATGLYVTRPGLLRTDFPEKYKVIDEMLR